MDNIREVSVYGKANPIMGKVVAATVQLERPEDPLAVQQRVQAYCRERLAPYQVPMLVRVSDDDLVGERFKKMRRLAAAQGG
jgi:acyl-coenzyme A synthetase/AMP-(fatty) acid ligase